MGNHRPYVLMATEGTYPFVGGGVSTWCDQICDGLDSVDYLLFAVTGSPEVVWKYPRRPTVKKVWHLPMWPGEEPAMFLTPGRYSAALHRRWRTTARALRRDFLPHLRTLLREILIGEVPIDELVDGIVGVGMFLQEHDYKQAMRSRGTWNTLLEVIGELFSSPFGKKFAEPSIEDVTMCARWLYHMLIPIALPLQDVTVFHSTIAAACALPGVVARKSRGISFVVTDHGVYLRE
ncbi:MAG: DUF3492 domain-containing protein, partial [Myxococcota bacterium]